MEMQKKIRSFGTHDGRFHADEVTACALLLLFDCIDRDQIIRTRDPKLLKTCQYVCDVGGVYDPEKKLFDHHQSAYQGKLSSAGMILEHLLKVQRISNEEYKFLNNTLILGVDAHDNGAIKQQLGMCSFSHVVSNYVPIAYSCSKKEEDACFFDALDFVYRHLQRAYQRYHYTLGCRKKVKKAMDKYDQCLYFEEAIPWMEGFFDLGGQQHPALFVIMPASGKQWKLRGIPPSYEDRMNVRKMLPEKWAGLLDQDFVEVSGIQGAIFCHKGRFISMWDSKEAAKKALEKVL